MLARSRGALPRLPFSRLKSQMIRPMIAIMTTLPQTAMAMMAPVESEEVVGVTTKDGDVVGGGVGDEELIEDDEVDVELVCVGVTVEITVMGTGVDWDVDWPLYVVSIVTSSVRTLEVSIQMISDGAAGSSKGTVIQYGSADGHWRN